MKFFLSSFIVLLTYCPVSYSQGQKSTGIQTVNPESENLSVERVNKLDDQVNQWIKEGQLNGATAIIFRKYASHCWSDPKNKMVVVFMRNIWPTEHWDYGDRIKPLIYQALK